jgi:hypothetical protein
MIWIRVLILLVLLAIFFQDASARSVYWIVFPFLTILFIVTKILQHHDWQGCWQPVVINLGFLMIQFLMVTAWFSVKNGHWINVTTQLLGWGDVLFLLSIAFYLSALNFICFYLSSLIGILLFWLIFHAIKKNKSKQIPLAGLQALLFSVFLASDWWCTHINVTKDYWLIKLIIK